MEERYGLLIDFEYCTGCQSCEVACKEEHGYPVGQWGIRVHEDGPWEIADGVFNFSKIPAPTDLCDLCAARTEKGREPSCVHHCLANVMKYGKVGDLAQELNKKGKQVLFVPQYLPLQAKGAFESKGKENRRHTFLTTEVSENAAFETATHGDTHLDIGMNEE